MRPYFFEIDGDLVGVSVGIIHGLLDMVMQMECQSSAFITGVYPLSYFSDQSQSQSKSK